MPCLCCPCLHLDFIMTVPGILKIAEMLIGVLCQSLLLNYGMLYAHILGASYASLLSTTCACIWSTCLLIFCYILSRNSYTLIRSTIFELVFNVAAALSYLSGSLYLAFAVKLYLYPIHVITFGLVPYPAMVASYSLGFILSVLYGLDSYYSFTRYQ